jgi:hypothetical protein
LPVGFNPSMRHIESLRGVLSCEEPRLITATSADMKVVH